ncbi:MAG: GntR family transcriptional regulator [Anaerolineae bacterium]|nr:GntR family transcriptional regulator [Anaerolineae bacterium]
MAKSNLSTTIYKTLKERIIFRQYPAGHHLTEDAICQEFDVSRIPAREALRMLEEKNLVQKIPHRGCTVVQPGLEEIREIYDVRQTLEVHVVEHLARHGMAEAEWQAAYDTWKHFEDHLNAGGAETAQVNSEHMAELDRDFHEGLARAAGNHFLCDMLRTVDERLHFIRVMDITSAERLRETCKQHLAILKHIQSGNVEAAREALRKNVAYGHGNVQSALQAALDRYADENQTLPFR